MISEPKNFCTSLGHKINPKTQFDDDFLLSLSSNGTFEPVCYDMTPSSAIWGRVPIDPRKKGTSTLKVNFFLIVISIISVIFGFA